MSLYHSYFTQPTPVRAKTKENTIFLKLGYTRGARVASGLLCGRRLGHVNLTWAMCFHPKKDETFHFYTVYMNPIVKISDFEVIFTSQNVFYFSKKNVRWSRLLGI